MISGSGSNGFLDTLGAGLDGLNNGGTANYIKTFTTSFQQDTTPVLGVPNFARGPGGFSISTATESSYIVTITTSTASGFIAGDQVVVTGVGVSGYNGTFTIASVSGTHFTYSDGTSGLGSSSGGLAYQGIAVPNDTGKGIPITLYNDASATDVTFTIKYNPSLLTIPSAFGGAGSDASCSASSFSLTSTTTIDSTHAFANFHYSYTAAQIVSPSGATESGTTVTITTTAAHGFVAGQTVLISGVSVSGYNGTFTIASVPSSTTFTYTAGSGLSAGSGGTAQLYSSRFVLGDVLGYVPNSAAGTYKANDLLQLGNIVINGVSSRTTRAVGVYVTSVDAYFGDTNGDGTIGNLDETDTSIGQGIGTGYGSYPTLDPVVVGDLSADYTINSSDYTIRENYTSVSIPRKSRHSLA